MSISELTPLHRVRHNALTKAGTLATLVSLALVASLFSGNSADLGLPISLDRPLFLAAIVLHLATSPWQRWRRLDPVLIVMILTVAWTVWSWQATGSLHNHAKTFALLDRIVMPFVVFLLGPTVFDTRAKRVLLLKTLTLIGIFIGSVAVFQIAGPHALVWPGYAKHTVLGSRATGPFASPEPLGMAGVVCAVAAGVLFVRVGGRGWRTLCCLSVATSSTAVLLCLTRSTWLAGVATLITLPIIMPALRRYVPAVLAAVAVVVAAVIIGLPSYTSNLTSRAGSEQPVLDRIYTNDAGVAILKQYPLTGIGWGRFIEVNTLWVDQLDTQPLTTVDIEIHDVFLARAAETGIPGAILWALAVILGPIAALRWRPPTREMEQWRLVAVAGFFAWLFPTLLSPNPYPFPNLVFWLVCGVLAGDRVLRRRAPAQDL